MLQKWWDWCVKSLAAISHATILFTLAKLLLGDADSLIFLYPQ